MHQLAITSSAVSNAPQAALTDRRLHGHWLLVARVGWVALALLIVGLNVFSIPIALQQAQVLCTSSICANMHYHQLTPNQAGELPKLGLSLGIYAAYVVGLDSAGALLTVGIAAAIFWLRSDDRMALFAAYMLLLLGGAAAFGEIGALAIVYPAWSLPVNLLSAAGQVAFYVFFCLFPSGRFAPRWMRWLALVYAAVWIGSLIFPAVTNPFTQSSLMFILFVSVLVVAQVYRYRRVSTPQERQKTKWVVFGFGLGIGGFIVVLTIGNFAATPNQPHPIGNALLPSTVLNVLLWLVPIFIAIPILRSRLWDVDILIRRTLIYGSLTAILAAVYFGAVIAAQAIGQALTGVKSPPAVVIVATTLLIAALFQPLRRGIQRIIDKRFYRRKYDAKRTLDAFGATLRIETDLADLSDHLVSVVQETMQPTYVSLWLHAPEPTRSEERLP